MNDKLEDLVNSIVYKQLYEEEKEKRIALEEELLFLHKIIEDALSSNKIELRIPKKIIDKYN